MVDNYELLLDVQRKSCYTCESFRKCNVLNDDVPCKYKPSKEAKKGVKVANGFWNTIYQVIEVKFHLSLEVKMNAVKVFKNKIKGIKRIDSNGN